MAWRDLGCAIGNGRLCILYYTRGGPRGGAASRACIHGVASARGAISPSAASHPVGAHACASPSVLTKLDNSGNGRLVERARLAELRDASAREASHAGGPLMFAPWEEWGPPNGRFLDLCLLAGCDYLDSLSALGASWWAARS